MRRRSAMTAITRSARAGRRAKSARKLSPARIRARPPVKAGHIGRAGRGIDGELADTVAGAGSVHGLAAARSGHGNLAADQDEHPLVGVAGPAKHVTGRETLVIGDAR